MLQSQVVLCVKDELFSFYFKNMVDNTLFLTTNNEIPSQLFLVKEKDITVILYDDIHGELKHTGQIEKIISNTIKIKNLVKQQTIQRRDETRVPFKRPIEIHQIQSDKLKEDKCIQLDKPMLIHSANISANGILFASELDIPMFVQFYIEFPLEHETINFWARVMRKEKNGKQILYGCAIQWDSETIQDKFRQFVFKQQVNKRLK